jgi:hypothetical protein
MDGELLEVRFSAVNQLPTQLSDWSKSIIAQAVRNESRSQF